MIACEKITLQKYNKKKEAFYLFYFGELPLSLIPMVPAK